MKSKIEWTDKTWNPITGCTKYSAGCANCYAEVMAKRLKAIGFPKYANGFEIRTHEDCLQTPLHWKGKYNVFVCSMSDLFHEKVPFEFIDKVMNVINVTHFFIFAIYIFSFALIFFFLQWQILPYSKK